MTVTLPADTGTRRYVGPADLKPAGTPVPTDPTNFAIEHVLLVDATNTPLVVAVDLDSGGSTANRLGVALLVPASGGPAVVPGDATNGLRVQFGSGASIELGATTLAALETISVSSLPSAASSTDIAVASSAASAQLVAANAARRGLLLTNTDTNDAYLYYGTTASLTKFSVRIPAGGYWEMPSPVYTGRLDCIWSGDGSGSLIGSEL